MGQWLHRNTMDSLKFNIIWWAVVLKKIYGVDGHRDIRSWGQFKWQSFSYMYVVCELLNMVTNNTT